MRKGPVGAATDAAHLPFPAACKITKNRNVPVSTYFRLLAESAVFDPEVEWMPETQMPTFTGNRTHSQLGTSRHSPTTMFQRQSITDTRFCRLMARSIAAAALSAVMSMG